MQAFQRSDITGINSSVNRDVLRFKSFVNMMMITVYLMTRFIIKCLLVVILTKLG